MDVRQFERLKKQAGNLSDADLSHLLMKISDEWRTPSSSGQILTDDLAPVEMLGMKAIDAIIQRELQRYKSRLNHEPATIWPMLRNR